MGWLYLVAAWSLVHALGWLWLGNDFLGLLLAAIPLSGIAVIHVRRHQWQGCQWVFWMTLAVGLGGWAFALAGSAIDDRLLAAGSGPPWRLAAAAAGAVAPLAALLAQPHRGRREPIASTTAIDVASAAVLVGLITAGGLMSAAPPAADPTGAWAPITIGHLPALLATCGLAWLAWSARDSRWRTAYVWLGAGQALHVSALVATTMAEPGLGWLTPAAVAAIPLASMPAAALASPPSEATDENDDDAAKVFYPGFLWGAVAMAPIAGIGRWIAGAATPADHRTLAVVAVATLAPIVVARVAVRRSEALRVHAVRAEHSLRQANKRLDGLANLDPLTTTLNRRGLEQRLATELTRRQGREQNLVGLLMDCDDFKRINDLLGHAVGDVVLTEVADRVRSVLRASDCVARVGGDEFLVLLPGSGLSEGVRIAERIRLSVGSSPVVRTPEPFEMTASLGVCTVPDEALSIEEILSLARVALKKSKAEGKNRVATDQEVSVLSRNSPDTELVDWLSRETTYKVVRQPILRFRDDTIAAYELLTRASISCLQMPRDFFRVALEHNILTLVDLLCLKACVATADQWEKATGYHVNLFPSTIINTPTDRLVGLIGRTASHHQFCLEVSEQQFFGDTQALRRRLAELREAGILVALDDVGFGRSSLELMILLVPDIVKIDRRFVHGAGRTSGRRKALQRLVAIIEQIGAQPIAEGIESQEDRDTAEALGVKLGQGYFLAQIDDSEPSRTAPPQAKAG